MKLYPSLHFFFNKFFHTNFLLIFCSYSFIFISCSSTKRVYSDGSNSLEGALPVRVLVNEKQDNLSIVVNSKINLLDNSGQIAEVNEGNSLEFTFNGELIELLIKQNTFISNEFWIESASETSLINVDEKKYRGKLRVFRSYDEIRLVNELTIEDYVKGVMTREMPIGNGTENYNALKAFSICIRTYAFNKITQKNKSFDLFADTRDQVYGGVVSETDYTNKIVDETAGQLLSFDGKPAVVFYHSTCGGYTEDVQNVFNSKPLDYLISISDGEGPYCNISPRYAWSEEYSESVFIDRLFNSRLLDNLNYAIQSVIVKSRFESGRVNELEIRLINSSGEEKIISLFSNNIRSVIKTSDGRSILRSTMFEISLDDNKNVLINGNGFGHGVGLCQWGAIAQSRLGKDYQEILNHYYPGTEIISIND